MPQFRNILVAADFSEHAQRAFELACALAAAEQTRLIVLHVAEPMHVVEQTRVAGASISEGAQQVALRQHLRETYAPDRPLEIEYRTATGAAADEILRIARESLCDLIVMGTHGRRGVGRALAGSVAEAVMRRARCPVLTIRLQDGAPGE